MFTKRDKIIITGCAGLVGQNLVVRLKKQGFTNLVGIDKHPSNTVTLRKLHPDITVLETDLADSGEWEIALAEAKAIIINQAQIGGLDPEDFKRNNIFATENILAAVTPMDDPPLIVLISSSVVNSRAVDLYAETKKAQEKLVRESGLPSTVIRPTLMFGWFDRKHLGWLSRFMAKMPIFPVPGSGEYIRQPLYVGDMCNIIIASLNGQHVGKVYDISGLEEISYIDIIRQIKETTRSRTRIVRIPYWLFSCLLSAYALVDKNPPFTTSQLKALVIPESFPIIDWPACFDVKPTAFREALEETFCDPQYSDIVLDF